MTNGDVCFLNALRVAGGHIQKQVHAIGQRPTGFTGDQGTSRTGDQESETHHIGDVSASVSGMYPPPVEGRLRNVQCVRKCCLSLLGAVKGTLADSPAAPPLTPPAVRQGKPGKGECNDLDELKPFKETLRVEVPPDQGPDRPVGSESCVVSG